MEPDTQGFFRETQQLAEEYVKDRLTLLKLQTAEKTAQLAAIAFSGMVIGIFSFLFLLFLSMLAVYFLKEQTGSWYYGIGIITAFYAVLVVVLVILRKQLLMNTISDAVIKLFFEESLPTHDNQ